MFINFPIGEPLNTAYEEFDEKGRSTFVAYENGETVERLFDDSYKNGEVPCYVIESKYGKPYYIRDGDEVILDINHGIGC